jgi:hypothetical protein
MKNRYLISSALALLLMTACGDATGVEPDDLAGTWTATSMVFTSTADPTLSADIVDDGAVMTLVLGTDGSYTFTLTIPGEETDNETGTYTASGTTLTFSETGTGSPEAFTISRDGDTMTLTDSDDEFDFTPGVEEDATLVITLTR